ncbi:transcriptional regulator [Pedobacter frigiditerrae]|uniref:Transcriptional regulator n=2 Tax=Pedobacter frigiditerrae TaxID=2530452 RepID=A0A4R0N625_9SPHI|nr:transcriptional regulator [Pedobacter frigiditerrae]
MQLGLMQSEVAEMFKVSADCITNWENNRNKPQINYYPSIISFLGYVPFELNTNTLSEKIFAYKCINGLSYKAFGKLLGVDASTIRCWEIDQGTPNKEKIKKLETLLTTKPLD